MGGWAYPEDGSAAELSEGGEKTEFAQVVRFEFVPGGKPDPSVADAVGVGWLFYFACGV